MSGFLKSIGPITRIDSQNDAKTNQMKYADAREYRAVAESVVEQISHHEPEHDTAHRSAESDQAGNRAHHAGRNDIRGKVITSVDQDCWPAKAMLKRTIANCTGACITSRITASLPR